MLIDTVIEYNTLHAVVLLQWSFNISMSIVAYLQGYLKVVDGFYETVENRLGCSCCMYLCVTVCYFAHVLQKILCFMIIWSKCVICMKHVWVCVLSFILQVWISIIGFTLAVYTSGFVFCVVGHSLILILKNGEKYRSTRKAFPASKYV